MPRYFFLHPSRPLSFSRRHASSSGPPTSSSRRKGLKDISSVGNDKVRSSTSNRRGSPLQGKERQEKGKMDVGSSDPWKVLIHKLDGAKSDDARFGKRIEKKISSTLSTDELKCQHFGVCSGCTITGNFTEAPVVKRAKNFFTSEGVGNVRIHIGDVHGWRTHAKLAVQPLSRWGGLKIGLYRAGSHEVEPIPSCRVHHPRINEAVEEFRRAATLAGVKGYSGGSTPSSSSSSSNKNKNSNRSDRKLTAPEGEVRYLQLSLERETGKVQLVVVWNALSYKEAEQSLPRLVKALRASTDLWHSITVNFQTSESNAIFSYHPKAWKLLWGPPTLREKVGLVSFFFRPQIFRQANLDMFERGILPVVLRSIPAGAKVAELYSGIGIIGLNTAVSQNNVSGASLVLCSDSNEYVDEVFDRCVESMPTEQERDRVFFENLAAEEAVLQGQCEEAEILIVDPPRKGLDAGVLKLLTTAPSANTDQSPPSELLSSSIISSSTTNQHMAPVLKRLVYISCGFDALERDTRELIGSGLWRIRSVDGFVLFPGSDHIETVVVFDKK